MTEAEDKRLRKAEEDRFTTIQRLIKTHERQYALCDYALSDNYDGPQLPAIMRASMEGGRNEAEGVLEDTWQRLRTWVLGDCECSSYVVKVAGHMKSCPKSGGQA